MANMAAKRASATAAGGSTAASTSNIADRRAVWNKIGIIALRDMQLGDLQPGWLTGVDNARAADISHNRLISLPQTLCNLSSLSSLNVSHNHLQDSGIPWQKLCTGLNQLTSLLLGHNQLQALPACLSLLSRLVQLGLQSNSLRQIQAGAFKGLGQLEVLQLQDNELE
eukprot:GHRR01026477.1.p2 GENE.GHRR01026477.1~~GHRR01026477.1.p2  ORF type:complete len:168 (+),score=60.13 GHRR01026477.1:745-1248(+)